MYLYTRVPHHQKGKNANRLNLPQIKIRTVPHYFPGLGLNKFDFAFYVD